jgi:hypothetical protein
MEASAVRTRTRIDPGAIGLGLAISMLLATACAGPTRVTAENQIATARYAIREASAKDAGSFAPTELEVAMAKFEEAKKATSGEGIRLAEEATVLARLASAVAERESARAQLEEAVRVQARSEQLRSETTEAVEETEQ